MKLDKLKCLINSSPLIDYGPTYVTNIALGLNFIKKPHNLSISILQHPKDMNNVCNDNACCSQSNSGKNVYFYYLVTWHD